MWSWWEHARFARWDVIVVGAGIVGLTAALHAAQRRPHDRILVIERGLLPSGASTKNAGFACFGSLTELAVDLAANGATETVDLVARRVSGLRRLRALLGDDALGYEACGGWELLPDRHLAALEHLDVLNDLLAPVFGGPCLRRDDTARRAFGFGDTAALVHLPFEGAIDTGKMMDALLAEVRAAGVHVWTGATVTAIHRDGVDHGVQLDDVHLTATRVAICTNAFTPALMPDLPITPGRGQVLVTERVPDLPFRGVFHHDEGYVYFRHTPDGRVMLGGFRHLDEAAEATLQPGTTPRIQDALEAFLRRVVLPGRDVPIAHRWSGTMAFGPQRAPLLQRMAPGLVVAARLGGMGVALGADVGRTAAGLLDEG